MATADATSGQPARPEHANFDEVLSQELAAILGQPPVPPGDAVSRALDSNLFGLALSGGGIRSATLSLGVMQALAGRQWLSRFHYLSTVSGGGYIGSWLSSWIARRKGDLKGVERELAGGGAGEAAEIQFLRTYSNYLTPRKGLLTVDTWTALATYLRNLGLNTIMYVSVVATCIIALLLFGRGMAEPLPKFLAYIAALLIMGAVATVTVGVTVKGRVPPEIPWLAALQSPRGVIWGLIVSLLLASLLGGLWWWVEVPQDAIGNASTPSTAGDAGCALARCLSTSGDTSGLRALLAWDQPLFLAIAGGLVTWLAFLGASLWVNRRIAEEDGYKAWHTPVFLLTSVIGIAVALFVGSRGFSMLYAVFGPEDMTEAIRRAFAVWASVPVVLFAFTAGIASAIGVLGNVYSDQGREWWARVVGWLMIWAFGWFVIVGLVFAAPGLTQWLASQWTYANYALAAGWVAVLQRAFAAGRATAGPGLARRVLMGVAPYLVGLGVIVMVTEAISALARPDAGESRQRPLLDSIYWGATRLMTIDAHWLGCALLAALAVAAVLAWRLDINRFSLHDFYRNRLVRCYLGATQDPDTRRRRADLFTGFWRHDNLPFAELAGNRPYPLVNGALNLVHGSRLAWQERMAASFVFSPLYCGYELPGQDASRRAYRSSLSYARDDDERGRGITLGTAMAVSGAAISPNAGYHSSPAFTFLLTLLNARTGAWLPNSALGGTRASPTIGLSYYLRELFGMTDDTQPYVNISDGGHGALHARELGRLHRRRCRMIVVVDGSADGPRQFDDLSASIRKCQVDLGVHIEIDVGRLVPRARDRRVSESCVAVGTIVYPTAAREQVPETAILIYAKSSLWNVAMSRAELRGYAATHPDFPHDTTADQFFDESQFESYRTLGFLIGKAMMGEMDRYLRDEMAT